MLGISVELGTYSIKFLTYQVEKKTIRFIATDEVIIDNEESETSYVGTPIIWKKQLEVLNEYLKKRTTDYQLLLNIPADVVTSRFLKFPIRNKKKARLMLPFQIEEDLPYSLSDCHWAETLSLESNSTLATVGIIRKEHFNIFFEYMIANNITPKALTSDVSNYCGFIKEYHPHFPSAFCIINLGHETTRSFYFLNGKLVSNHHSYVAGRTLTQAISKTYDITYDEAVIYKHQNSFLLLEEQYEQVNENQREFAKTMDTALAPLLSEVRRWDIGFRVKHGEPVKSIYICGGTSNIKNIENYLCSKLNIDIQFFDPFKLIPSPQISTDEKLRRNFSQLATLSSNAPKKSQLVNFLTGDYTLTNNTDLPIESMIFISSRLILLAFIASSFFIFETLILSSSVSNAKKYAKKLYKNKILETSLGKPAIRRAMRKNNIAPILTKLQGKEKMIQQEINIMQSSLNTTALPTLMDILRKISAYDVEIVQFSSGSDLNIDFTLQSRVMNDLEGLAELFKKDPRRKWIVELNKKKLSLAIGGTGRDK